ncbi:MAG: hypothetical protein LBE33_11145 [Zoogloeaceae bacterium]|jgi:hypothetical protein|nr:hypothetical protein [Zoogloeaceae bacterium]
MQARRLPALRGWNWITEGFRLFRVNPALLTFLVFGYWLVLAVLNLLPLIGIALAPLCMPAFLVSVMNGCRALEGKTGNDFGLLFSGFRQNRAALLILGAVYLLSSIAVFAASAVFDGGELLNIVLGNQPPPEDWTQHGDLVLALQAILLMLTPVLMAFWFAPMLSAWDNVPAGKALFFSFVACLRNWRAFLVYGLGVTFISAILPGLILHPLNLVLSKSMLSVVAVAMSLPLLFVFTPTLFASFYVSYRDVFTRAAHVTDATDTMDAADA